MDFIVGIFVFVLITVITIVCAVCAGIAMAILVEEMFDE